MANSVSAAEARKELARRELERRRASASVAAPRQEQVMSAYEPSMMERAANFFQDKGVPIQRMKREAQSADDLVRLAANEMTFQQADRLSGLTSEGGKEAEWAKTAAADERAGGAGDLAQVAGAVAAPLGAARQGVTLAGKFGTDAMKGLPGLLTRTGLMGAEGAAYGGATAAGNDQDIKEGAGWGALFGVGGNLLGEAAGNAFNKIVGLVKGKPPELALEELRAAKSAAYDEADKLGVQYAPDAFKDMVGDIATTARSGKISRIRHPHSVDMIEDLIGHVDKGAAPTLTEMDQLRQVIWRDLAGSKDEAEAHFGKMMIDKIDDFIDADTTQVLSGKASDASEAIKRARELNRRYKNAQTLDEALVKAERRAASTDSGQNAENTMRQNVRRILDNKQTNKYLNDEEREALEAVVRGTTGQNFARWAGKKLTSIPGSSGALGTGAGLGLLFGGPAGGAVGATVGPMAAALTGGGLKAMSRGFGKSNERMAETLIRGGELPRKALSSAEIEMLSRLLMGGGVNARSQLGHQ